MQGKEPFEHEASNHSSVGIDVSKDWLDVHVLPQAETYRVANSKAGFKHLMVWLKRFRVGLIVMEATGKWHRPAQRSLLERGFRVAVIDPYRLRAFAKAEGIRAKNDKLDAKVLALFAQTMNPKIREPSPQALEDLAELVTARDTAVAEQTSLKNQLAAATTAFLKRQLTSRLKRIAKDIESLAAEMRKRLAADPALARRYAILTSIPSFGQAVATTLIACLRELGACSRRQIAHLAGLAPMDDDSGQRKGQRVVFGGRPAVRRALYLAALSACVHNPPMKAFYDHLIDQGKSAKCALIAVARKLITLANTLIAENRLWETTAPKSA